MLMIVWWSPSLLPDGGIATAGVGSLRITEKENNVQAAKGQRQGGAFEV